MSKRPTHRGKIFVAIYFSMLFETIVVVKKVASLKKLKAMQKKKSSYHKHYETESNDF